jgi:CheY-like chemotaxis protein
VIYDLGPRANRVYTSLRDRIVSGEFPLGAKLPPHTELAKQFGVAPLTMRQVLGRLEEEGLVSREQGRGTFIREHTTSAVLIVDDHEEMRALLRVHVESGGHRAITASGPIEAMSALESDSSITLVFSDVRMPEKQDGIEFIRAVRRRWPQLPLAVMTGFTDDLTELHGTPEWPILVLSKPVWAHQIQEALRMALSK